MHGLLVPCICVTTSGTFWTNPQYRVTIPEADDDDEEGEGGIIVGLMQKDRRKMRKEGKDNITIGYAIYRVNDFRCAENTPAPTCTVGCQYQALCCYVDFDITRSRFGSA